MYPRSYYKSKEHLQLVQTAVPTGVLRNPLDLINSARPWVMVNPHLSTMSSEKKTLIFADHIYKNRRDQDKVKILVGLRRTKLEGFSILILNAEGDITEWDGWIPENYFLNLRRWTIRAIHETVWKQCGFAVSSVHVLDAFTVCERVAPRGINWNHFYSNPEQFIDLIVSLPQNIYNVSFYNGKQVQQFISLMHHEVISRQLHKFYNLILCNIDLSQNEIETLLNSNMKFNSMVFDKCTNFTVFIKKMIPVLIKKNVREIGIYYMDVDAADIELIINSCNELNSLNLISAAVHGDIKGDSGLSKLEKIRISRTKIKAESVLSIINRSHYLKILLLHNCDNISPILPYINSLKLSSLRLLSLSRIIFSGNFLENLLSVSIYLEQIDLSYCSNTVSAFKSLNEFQLKNLHTIILPDDMNTASLHALCRAAPNLTKLILWSFDQINEAFRDLPPSSLLKMKEIDASGTNLTGDGLENILRLTSNLETLDIRFCDNISKVNELFSYKLNYLSEIDANGSDITARYLEHLLNSAPQIIFLYISRCMRALPVFKSDTLLQLKNLQNIEVLDTNSEYLNISLLKKKMPRLSIISAESLPPSFPLKPYANSQQKLTTDEFLNTAEPLFSFYFKAYFPYVDPSRYRLSVWKPLVHTLEPPEKFLPQDFQNVLWDNTNYLINDQFICEKGVISVTPLDGNLIILPSLDHEEKIFDMEVINEYKKCIDTKLLQLQHSPSTGFHRLILPHPDNFTIHFTTATRGMTSKPKLPANLETLLAKYKKHLPNATSPGRKFSSLKEFSQYIREEKTGHCLHRSLAAYDELENEHKNDVHIIINDVHAFVEVKVENNWYQLDLGGYPASMKKIPMTAAELEEKKPSTLLTEQINLPNYSINEVWTRTTDILVMVANNLGFRNFYAELKLHSSLEDIFIAHGPEDLSLTGTGITIKGEMLTPHTRFNQWLKNRKHGYICVDVRDFYDQEIAQLNDLLDRKIENYSISADIRIIILDYPGNHHFGSDFKRRISLEITMPLLEEKALFEDISTLNQQSGKTIEIDLFHSVYWQRALIGAWQLTQNHVNDSFSFRWEKGELFSLLTDSPSSIRNMVIKNPPLYDTSFTSFVAELQSLRRFEWADQISYLPEDIYFYETVEGYKNNNSCASVELIQITGNEASVFILSNVNILSFIQDPFYGFSKKNNQLQIQDSHLTHCKNQGIAMDVVCVYGLENSAVAQLLVAAKKKNVGIHFLFPNIQALPEDFPVKLKDSIGFKEKPGPIWRAPQVEWQMHHDVYFAHRKMLFENPHAYVFDMSSLDVSELGRFPILAEDIKTEFLRAGRLKMTAPLAAILRFLQNQEVVVLSGKIPPALYEALTSLSLGLIEGERYSGKLIILALPEDAPVVQAITGRIWGGIIYELPAKIDLLQKIYPAKEVAAFVQEYAASLINIDFADLERQYLQYRLDTLCRVFTENDSSLLNDEERAQRLDEERLMCIRQAFSLSPWVMIPGATGIGKTHFLQHLFPAKEGIYKLEEWHNKIPTLNNEAILVVDEANFESQLHGQGEHFLERFKSLLGSFPHFLNKGQHYTLTKQHRVIFAFNPARYGAGRSTTGLLTQHALVVAFKPLPDFYLRARIIKPLLKEVLKESDSRINVLAEPCSMVYSWLITYSSEEEVLVTPRDIKAMVNLIASKIKNGPQRDEQTLMRLASEIAYDIGKQALSENPAKLKAFEYQFKPVKRVMDRMIPEHYLAFQHQAYSLIKDVLQARASLLSSAYTDLGLGGIMIEGASGIGKSYFMNQLIAEEENRTQKKSYRITTAKPYHEKENLLRESFAAGALVVIDDFNTSMWPNKLLNNFMMGLDESGKPATNPGFMLLVTQCPPSSAGHIEDDTALRKRFIKIAVDWPLYSSRPKINRRTNSAAFFNGNLTVIPEVSIYPHLPPPSRVSSKIMP